MTTQVTIRDLLGVGAHFGHRTRSWNPKMEPYIFGSRNKIHIINLEKTASMFQDVLNYVGRLSANKAKILFVGTKRAARESVRNYAKQCGMPYVDHRWLGGMLTNYKTVRQSIFRLKELKDMQAKGALESMIKKEALMLSRELEKLERGLGGIEEMGGLPDALFVVDVGFENIAVEEAHRLKIPVIGIVDTNNSPDKIDYIIPGNDDSKRSIDYYLKALTEVILASRPIQVEAPKEAAPAPVVKTVSKTVKVAAVEKKKVKTSEEIAAPEGNSEAKPATEKPKAKKAEASEVSEKSASKKETSTKKPTTGKKASPKEVGK